ncbi:hypothetical protein BMT54_09630, partial [Pasteurellaceae bacterium 15-036681]
NGQDGAPGKDGAPGADGKDGKSVVAEVQPDGSVKVSEVDPETKEKTEIATITNGTDGKDGKSVVAEVQPDGSVKVSEVDPETKEKTEIATITNGTDGKDGKSVVAEVQPDGSVKVSEVDPETKEKTEIATITNGQDGAPGRDGVDGKDGKDATFETGTSTVEEGKAKPTETYTDNNGDPVTVKKGDNGTNIYTDKDGKPVDPDNVTETTDKDKVATVGDITDTINKVYWTVDADKVEKSTGEVDYNPEESDVKAGDTVTLNAGNNIKISGKGKDINIATTMNPTFDSVHANNNITIAGSLDTYTANGKPVTRNEDGTYSYENNETVSPDTKVETVPGKAPITITSVKNEAGDVVKNEISGLDPTLPTGTSVAKVDNAGKPVVDKEGKPVSYVTNITNPEVKPEEKTNAATIEDVLRAGWNLETEDKGKLDFVQPYDTVKFINGKGTTVTSDSDGKSSSIAYNANVDNKTTLLTYTGKDGNLVYVINGENGQVTYNTRPDGTGSEVKADAIDLTKGSQITAVTTTTVNGDTVIRGDVNFVDGKTTTVTANPQTGDVKVEVKAGETKVTDAGKAVVNTTKLEDAVKAADAKVVEAQKALDNAAEAAEAAKAEAQKALDTAKANAAAAKSELETAGDRVATVKDITDTINGTHWTVGADKVEGSTGKSTYTANDGSKIKAGDKVTVKAGNNIEVSGSGSSIHIATTMMPTFDTVVANESVTVGTGNKATTISSNEEGVTLQNNRSEPVRIQGVKAGEKGTDAVNVDQLKQGLSQVNQHVNKVDKDLRAGIAGANAAAGLPQVYLPGKSMVAASAGTFKGQNAVAVGYSRASDNGKLILKLQGNANTRGEVGGSVGVGYQW